MNEQLVACLAVIIGGGLGSLARYSITLLSARLWGEAFPWGTLGINVAGSFVIGLFFTLTLAEGAMPAGVSTRLFVMTGICGGFTTFSAFSLQTLQLMNEREYGSALFYVAASLVCCLAAVGFGHWLGAAAHLPKFATPEAVKRPAVLAVAPRLESLEACLNAAEQIAPGFGKPQLVALHVRHDPDMLVATSEEVLGASTAAEFRANEERQAAVLHNAVDAWIQLHGNDEASLLDLTTDLGQALHAHARDADVIILGKPQGKSSVEDREALTIALAELKRPVLLVPADWRGSVGTAACIAWKAAPQAARAVEAAAPLLKRGKAVTVLAGDEDGEESSTGDVDAILRNLGIEAAVKSFSADDGPVGVTLLKLAHAQSADLLVMGAYSHSRLAEAVLGGVTRDILAEADLPVWMVH